MPCAVLEAGDTAGNNADMISVLMKLTFQQERKILIKQQSKYMSPPYPRLENAPPMSGKNPIC